MSKTTTDNKKDNMPKSCTTAPIETAQHPALETHNHAQVFSDVDSINTKDSLSIKTDTGNDCHPSESCQSMSKSTRIIKDTGTYTNLIACNGKARTHHRPYHTIC
jgi:hypothetical protein